MLFLREILLLAMVLCVCWETGDTRCRIECDQSQIGLALPTCYLRDDGISFSCGISLRSSDTVIRTLGSFDKLTLILDLQTRVNRLYIYNYIGNKFEVNAFRFHSELTRFSLHYENNQFHPGMLYLFPNLKSLGLNSVSVEYFPYFTYVNRFLSHLSISRFNIPSTTPRILRRDHVSGLTGLKYLYLSPNQYMNTTDQSFTGLTALTYLFLERFHIPNPTVTLSPLVRLRELYLIRCNLSDISFLSQTPSLYGLTELVLNYNFITHVPAGTFSGYTNLAHLYLYDNRLLQLECGAFTGLIRLRSLGLGNNPIQQICLNAFKGLKSLTRIYLHSPSITSLSSRTFEYLPSLKLIYLSDSPLHCDCYLQWMSIVHHSFSLTISFAYCASPSEHIGKLATDLSIYTNCTPEYSYQCFNRANRCPSGSYCQDTLDTYTCVCEQEGYLFVRSLNRCVSSQEIINGLQRLSDTTPTCPTTTCATCPTCPTCATCPTCPTTATYPVTRSQPCKYSPTTNRS